MRDYGALHRVLAERAATPFAWGRRNGNDCVAHMLAAIEAQTGRDILPDHDWATQRGARRVINAVGGLEHALDVRLRRIPPALAQRGDVAAVPDEAFGITVLIVMGSMLVGPGELRQMQLPRSSMMIAWSAD